MSDSLQLHELQHTRPPCPSPTSRVHPNPRPSSQRLKDLKILRFPIVEFTLWKAYNSGQQCPLGRKKKSVRCLGSVLEDSVLVRSGKRPSPCILLPHRRLCWTLKADKQEQRAAPGALRPEEGCDMGSQQNTLTESFFFS